MEIIAPIGALFRLRAFVVASGISEVGAQSVQRPATIYVKSNSLMYLISLMYYQI
jgi:hypothetical protein